MIAVTSLYKLLQRWILELIRLHVVCAQIGEVRVSRILSVRWHPSLVNQYKLWANVRRFAA
jgi:hypothetical protein